MGKGDTRRLLHNLLLPRHRSENRVLGRHNGTNNAASRVQQPEQKRVPYRSQILARHAYKTEVGVRSTLAKTIDMR